ncbi:hypothetical protein LCL96_02945 [Rossellomorea aquimaris]|uniref:hypothetical protein n=1 Tax=Rossellomorea aquimaris TaxID=189382 RepID=UPI001CD66DAF|nr:hypothetical protein [Rossellomorea aquimaris]MCA1057870.1 hypothetical protein [Rossellomorea aquimaris]
MIYLFSLVALILLLPILYFVPIGISKQGKLLIAGLSFGLTLLGIVASSQYPIWAISIMLVVLLGLASYMIEQRFSGLMLVTAGAGSNMYEEQKIEVQEPQELDIHKERVSEDTPEVRDVTEEISEEEEMEQIDLEEHVEENETEILESNDPKEPLQDQDEILLEHIVAASETESTPIQDDESEWFIENTNEMMAEQEVLEESELIDVDLSEIESMINDSDLEEAVEEMEVIPVVRDETENEELADEEEKADLEAELLEEENLLEGPENDIYQPAEKESHEDQLPKRNRIMREVMKTMIEQISLSRSLLSTDQMENMLKHYLHPSLHDQDYYTFARILMDHYMTTKQYEDLAMFTKGIEERFKEYPYIKLDIEQTKEMAMENQTK